MQTEHAHHAKTRGRICDGLWITPDSGHHVEKRLDIVADGFEPRNIIAAQSFVSCGRAALAQPGCGKLITSPIAFLHMYIGVTFRATHHFDAELMRSCGIDAFDKAKRNNAVSVDCYGCIAQFD